MRFIAVNDSEQLSQSAMKQNQTLEFVWQGIASLGASAEMFTHVLDSFYTTPRGFDWEHGVSQILPLGDGPPVVITQQPSYITKTNVRRRYALTKSRNVSCLLKESQGVGIH